MAKTLDQIQITSNSHTKQCKSCFMTGKSCIYERYIEASLTEVEENTAQKGSAFVLMPFRKVIDEVYRSQIDPCLRSVVKNVSRADDISRTGYVICEKICKQIQSSHIICAEISRDNANVFYELGLAYAMEKDIVLLTQKGLLNERKNLFNKLSFNDEFTEYDPFERLEAKHLKLWQQKERQTPRKKEADEFPGGDYIFVLLSDTEVFEEPFESNSKEKKLKYSVDSLCYGIIRRALSSLREDDQLISMGSPIVKTTEIFVTIKDDGYHRLKTQSKFQDVETYIRDASCVIICTSQHDPSSYFWLGFAHGLQKDVIPITAQKPGESESATFPFDVRALWHIYFHYDTPSDLYEQLKSILEIIFRKDEHFINRRRFWYPFLDEGRVSIFVGSVELTKRNRHVVGEWDYRTVSELSSFFVSRKETMETIFQTPTFQASAIYKNANQPQQLKQYVNSLKNKLTSGSSIVIATADSNDMTEVALSNFSGTEPFESKTWKDPTFSGVIAVKSSGDSSRQRTNDPADQNVESLYFQLVDNLNVETTLDPTEQEILSEAMKTGTPGAVRGFWDISDGNLPQADHTFKSVYIPYSKKTDRGFTSYFGHIAKFALQDRTTGKYRWCIVLQGVTGPATLGVAQVLTGGQKQFTVFDDSVDATHRIKLLEKVSMESSTLKSFMPTVTFITLAQHSEDIVKKFNYGYGKDGSVEAIIKVYVIDGVDVNHDERKIIWWDLANPASCPDMFPREMRSKIKKR